MSRCYLKKVGKRHFRKIAVLKLFFWQLFKSNKRFFHLPITNKFNKHIVSFVVCKNRFSKRQQIIYIIVANFDNQVTFLYARFACWTICWNRVNTLAWKILTICKRDAAVKSKNSKICGLVIWILFKFFNR